MARRRKVKSIDLESAVSQALREYGEDVANSLDAPVEQVAKDTVQTLKTTGDYDDLTGDYRKSFAYSVENGYRGVTATVFSEAPDYRITHLLERPHLTRNGTSRTRGFPHWGPAAQKAENEAIARVKKALEEVGGG